MKYRKKPVIIEAIRYTGKNADDVLIFADTDQITNDFLENWIEIPTLEGTMKARPGDWVIRGVKGELYPCKDDIFQMTYESVETKPRTDLEPDSFRITEEGFELVRKGGGVSG